MSTLGKDADYRVKPSKAHTSKQPQKKSVPITDAPTVVKSGIAAGLIQQRGQLATTTDLHVKTVAGVQTLVDPALASSARYSVVVDGDAAYDAYLTQVDAAKNVNKYYVLQLLVDAEGEYAVWTRWGRVGEQQRFQNALKSAPSKEAALKVFLQTFKSKTTVGWPDRANAVPGRNGKYALVERIVVAAKEADEADEADEAAPTVLPSLAQLDPRVRAVAEYVVDASARRSELSRLGVDVGACPSLRLAPSQVAKAHDVLGQISQLVSGESATTGDATCELRRLTDAFHTLVPTPSGRAVAPLIDTVEAVGAKLEALEALAAPPVKEGGDAAAALVAQLPFQLTPVDTTGTAFETLKAMVADTAFHGYGMRVVEAIEVVHPQPWAAGSKRSLAFHGTRRVNLEGILTAGGLRLKNKAVKTGSMFGNGVYLATAASKSYNYCFSSKVLFVVEALAGTSLELSQATPDAHDKLGTKYHSVFAAGRTTVADSDPFPGDSNLLWPSDFTANPKPSSLLFDELILYDENRVRLKYLLVVDRVEGDGVTPPGQA